MEADVVKTITKEELKAKIDAREEFKLVDVRDTPDYRRAHIPGAVHLLIGEMDGGRIRANFRPEEEIVVYSRDIDCPAKFIAARMLMDFGYPNVLAYPGSWKEWEDAGYPVEIVGISAPE
jgi:rhodanese-related sulfurtransferase